MTAPNRLGEAPVKALFFQYYVPALTSILSITVHEVINGVILARTVGKEGVAAVGLYGPVVIMLVALALPVMIGTGILLGKSIGAADYGNAQRIFAFVTTLALLLGGAVALTSPLFLKPLAVFLAGNASLADNLAGYMRWQLVGLPLFFLNLFWAGLLRSDGAPEVTRNASLVAVALNLGLDLLLVVGLRLGVEGASGATVLGRAAAAGYLALHLGRGKNHFGFRGFRFTVRLAAWRELVRLGLPSFASEVSVSTGLLLITRAVVPYGPAAVAAFGVVNHVSFILLRPFTSAMIAVLPIVSFNIGAGLPGRVLETVKFALAFTLGLGLVVAACGLAAPGWLVTWFAGNDTAAFRRVAGGALSLYFLLFLAAGPNYILAAYFQSIGKPGVATAVPVLKGLVLVALLLAVLPGTLGLGGVWLSRSGAEIGTLLLVGGYTWANREKYFGEKAVLRGK